MESVVGCRQERRREASELPSALFRPVEIGFAGVGVASKRHTLILAAVRRDADTLHDSLEFVQVALVAGGGRDEFGTDFDPDLWIAGIRLAQRNDPYVDPTISKILTTSRSFPAAQRHSLQPYDLSGRLVTALDPH